MKGRTSDAWFPFWIDKWLLGSTRDELIIRDSDGKFIEDLRGIFADLMALAYKDSGFVRANEGSPYPTRRLAGTLDVPEDKLAKTIEICIEKGKLRKMPDGTLYLISSKKYELSRMSKWRRMKEIEAMEVADKDYIPGLQPADCNAGLQSRPKSVTQNRIEKNRLENILSEFELFWDYYPKKVAKEDALAAFKALRKIVDIKEIASALNGYNEHLRMKKRKSREDKLDPDYILHPGTFLRKNRWKDYIGVVDKPTL